MQTMAILPLHGCTVRADKLGRITVDEHYEFNRPEEPYWRLLEVSAVTAVRGQN